MNDAPPEPVEVPRKVFLVYMTPSCWDDDCYDCQGCSCACHDQPPVRTVHVTPAPRRCRTCGYLIRSESHKIACRSVMDRVMRLADSIGAGR